MKTCKNFLSVIRTGYCFQSCVQTTKLITAAFITLISGAPEIVNSQSFAWRELPGVEPAFGFQDLSFINANTGWAIDNNGRVQKTTNSGDTWTSYTITPLSSNRSVGFFDSLHGIVGDFYESEALNRTTNGGINWAYVKNVEDLQLAGICGISIVNENTAYACGTYNDAAKVCKSTDKGFSWTVVFNDTSLARSLVDCYFWSPDSGIAAGGYNTNVFGTGNSVVILTTNGGNTWQRVYKSSRTHEWCWKISFNPVVSKTFGVVSLQRLNGLLSYYLKTTDNGFSWTEFPFMDHYFENGIGFLNENTGWIGGSGSSAPGGLAYQTTNGGLNWDTVGNLTSVNRIRFINDTLAFAAGRTISKYSRYVVGISTVSTEIPITFNLYQNFPNPFNPRTNIKFDIPVQVSNNNSNAGNNNTVMTNLTIYDQLGKVIKVIVNEYLNPGSYTAGFDGGYYPSGIYYYKLETGSGLNTYSQTKKMLILK